MKVNKAEVNIENATQFEVDHQIGLTNEQLATRSDEKLFNKTPKRVTKSYLQIFLDNVLNFFNILLFVIAIIMLIAGIGYVKDGNYGIVWQHLPSYFFMVILISNISIGLFQDIHARKLVDSLKVVSSLNARVLRNGEESEIDSAKVVLSDIIILKTGDQIVADGVVVEGKKCCGGLFADDIVLIAPGKSSLRNILNKVHEWALTNEMTFGINKCATMVIKPLNFVNSPSDKDPTFYLGIYSISKVSAYLYLGIPFRNDLSLTH